jgi:photosystem II PsbZ protein
MITAIQISTSLLILISFVLVVGVPVILATPGEWENSKGTVWKGTAIWTGLVTLTSFLNSLA